MATTSPENTKICYTVREAVQASGVSRSELYRAFQRGDLTCRKRGRTTLILADDLRAWARALPTAQQNKAA